MTEKIKELLAGLDKDCVSLVAVMNKIPGIQTIESCCGHGKGPYHIWFCAASLENLPTLLYWFDGCHCGYYSWRVFVTTDCAMSPVHFCLEGPIGEQAYYESAKIAALIAKQLAKGDRK